MKMPTTINHWSDVSAGGAEGAAVLTSGQWTDGGTDRLTPAYQLLWIGVVSSAAACGQLQPGKRCMNLHAGADMSNVEKEQTDEWQRSGG